MWRTGEHMRAARQPPLLPARQQRNKRQTSKIVAGAFFPTGAP